MGGRDCGGRARPRRMRRCTANAGPLARLACFLYLQLPGVRQQSGRRLQVSAGQRQQGRNLILAYFAMSGDLNGNPTGFSPGGGATLLGGNIAWNGAGVGGQGFPEAQQAFVQTAQAAINPSMTATGDTQHYNCVAVALKAASAGNPAPAIGSGVIWIKRVLHFSNQVMPASWTLQTPVDGNLRVLKPFNSSCSAIADSEGGTWTSIGTDKMMWYSKGRAANNASTTTVSTSGASGSSRFFDIINADANPLDTFAEALSIDTSNQTTLSNAPNITPGAQNELILVSGNNGIGPTTAVTSPSGALFNMVTYTGQQDGSSMDTSDYGANLYNGSDISLEHWNWTLSSQPGNQANIVAAAFKAAPASQSFSSTKFGVVGLASAEW